MLLTTLAQAADATPGIRVGSEGFLDIFNGYIVIFAVAFVVTLAVTPLMRKFAIDNGIIDRPDDPRKAHSLPVAYLGGIGVFIGLIAALGFAYLAPHLPDTMFYFHESEKFGYRFLETQLLVPPAVLLGIVAITITGLLDDVLGLDPRLKIVGQLIAAAALALEDFGVRLAEGLIMPFARAANLPMIEITSPTTDVTRESLGFIIDLPAGAFGGTLEIDLIYWIGTAIIAIFVLGGCNASNLIDGLDGLLSGVTAIAAFGLLIIAVHLASVDDGPRDASRIILCMALMGACLGFLPHNFNPATIFLGDCGSLLLGYLTIVIVLSLGDTGQTHLVVAGLIVYSIPIIDTCLAIVRRKMAGKRMSAADDQHLHHMLKRRLGVRGAVMALYLLGASFAAIGVWLSSGPIRLVFTVAMVLFGFVGVTAIKFARRAAIEAQVAKLATPASIRPPTAATTPPAVSSGAGAYTSSPDASP